MVRKAWPVRVIPIAVIQFSAMIGCPREDHSMKFRLVSVCLLLSFFAPLVALSDGNPAGLLLVVNQFEHTALLIDLASRKTISTTGVDINGHEVVVSPDGRLGYVPIYGNSGVGKPGTDGGTIQIVDLQTGRAVDIINLPKPVRPHCAKFGPDGLLYVTAELANAVYALDLQSRKVVAEIPTGRPESHMLVISPDGSRAYTANVSTGTLSVLDLRQRSLITVIPVAKRVQRLSLSPDGKWLFTHDQDAPRIAVIDTTTMAVARWIDVPSTVYSSLVTPDGNHLIADSPVGKLFVLNLSAGGVEKTYEIPGALGEVTLTSDGSHAYVSCPQAGTIEVLNLREGKLEEPLPLTKGVDGLAWLPSVAK
jgi:DNA-binding beta-propeller fold protein YncE